MSDIGKRCTINFPTVTHTSADLACPNHPLSAGRLKCYTLESGWPDLLGFPPSKLSVGSRRLGCFRKSTHVTVTQEKRDMGKVRVSMGFMS